ncbi:hypothetical protein SSYRP_v1c08290 [Spiroplasma syrphidicola EA-1]|uniref:Transmembrane protein n=1 Tax=Spiroplasma syrphidicola EA-1 TaxID=1276229 RepID=R4U705_9MOLU|nr:hypothetical protein [Spiroplasma syrphidicola]AGM26418.1 hypothetical protein SSYRP_v1c08290 [Spiroplasma syrphidicola EA-1]
MLQSYKRRTLFDWIILGILFLILTSGLIAFLTIEFTNDLVNFNIIGLIGLLLFLCFLIYLIKLITSKQSNNVIKLQKKDKTSVEEIINLLLLCLFLSLFIKGYGLYGFWTLLFKLLSPVVLVGLTFLFTLMLGLIIPNLKTSAIIIPILLIYPFIFVDSNLWMGLGAIISGLTITNFVNVRSQYYQNIGKENDSLVKKYLWINAKVIGIIIIVLTILYFTIGMTPQAFFNNNLDINFTNLLINLIPFLLLLGCYILNLKMTVCLPILVLLQIVLGLTLDLFNVVSIYNSNYFVLIKSNLFVNNNSLVSIFEAVLTSFIWFFVIIIIDEFTYQYNHLILSLRNLNSLWEEKQLDCNIKSYGKYHFWVTLLLIVSFENTPTIARGLKISDNTDNKIKTYLVQNYLSFSIWSILPFSFNTIWVMIWTSAFTNFSLGEGYLKILQLSWGNYLIIWFALLFISFSKIYDLIQMNWISTIKFEIKSKPKVAVKNKTNKIRGRWNKEK